MMAMAPASLVAHVRSSLIESDTCIPPVTWVMPAARVRARLGGSDPGEPEYEIAKGRG